jgi:hypothetical protein
MLHFKIFLDGRCAQGSSRQSLAFLRTAKTLADFLAEVLKHDSPPRLIGGSATGLSATDARGVIIGDAEF